MERLSASNPSVQFLSLLARLEEILRSLSQHFEACDTELKDLRSQVSQSRERARALSEEGAQKNQQSQNEAEKRIETDKENRVLRAALDDAIACLSAYLEVHPDPKHLGAPSPGVLPAGLSQLEAQAGVGPGAGAGPFFGSPSREKSSE